MITFNVIKIYETKIGQDWVKNPEKESCKELISTHEYYNTLLTLSGIDKIHHRKELPSKVVSLSPSGTERITYLFNFKDSDAEKIEKELNFHKGRQLAHEYCQEYFLKQLAKTGESSFLGFESPIEFAYKLTWEAEIIFFRTYGEHYQHKLGYVIEVFEHYIKVGEALLSQYELAFEISKGLGIDNIFIA